jgi:hypothetical protein
MIVLIGRKIRCPCCSRSWYVCAGVCTDALGRSLYVASRAILVYTHLTRWVHTAALHMIRYLVSSMFNFEMQCKQFRPVWMLEMELRENLYGDCSMAVKSEHSERNVICDMPCVIHVCISITWLITLGGGGGAKSTMGIGNFNSAAQIKKIYS